jgi:hypothetical protein
MTQKMAGEKIPLQFSLASAPSIGVCRKKQATMSQPQDAIAMAEQEMAYRVELFNKCVLGPTCAQRYQVFRGNALCLSLTIFRSLFSGWSVIVTISASIDDTRTETSV